MAVSIKIKMLENAKGMSLPSYATEQSAGFDLSAAIEDPIVIKPEKIHIVPTGISMALPVGFEAQVRPRSGLAAKYGITVLNTPGTIDADYRGEFKVILINHGKEEFIITRGMRIAQVVISKYKHVKLEAVEILDETKRGSNGFGSTGN